MLLDEVVAIDAALEETVGVEVACVPPATRVPHTVARRAA